MLLTAKPFVLILCRLIDPPMRSWCRPRMFMSNHDAWRWRHRAVAVKLPFLFALFVRT
jgi:hypothetical protein